MFTEEEYRYFRAILEEEKGVFKMSTMRLQMYWKFNALPSEEKMYEMLARFDKSLIDILEYIFSE
jgi:hypothetical protein